MILPKLQLLLLPGSVSSLQADVLHSEGRYTAYRKSRMTSGMVIRSNRVPYFAPVKNQMSTLSCVAGPDATSRDRTGLAHYMADATVAPIRMICPQSC